MIYYIYHIPGVKIGCTKHLESRMKKQGFTDWDILETHTDIQLASNREKELQKEYGYRVDGKPYYMMAQGSNQCIEAGRKGGQAPKNHQRVLTIEEAGEIRSKYIPHKYTMQRLAKEYNVSYGVINSILHNKSYTK